MERKRYLKHFGGGYYIPNWTKHVQIKDSSTIRQDKVATGDEGDKGDKVAMNTKQTRRKWHMKMDDNYTM